jgi:hypothetical protein
LCITDGLDATNCTAGVVSYRLLARRPTGAYFVIVMATPLCAKCGAELAAGTSFCRLCGAPVGISAGPSEQQTALLNQTQPKPTTQRLDARPTSGPRDAIPPGAFDAAPVQLPVSSACAGSRRSIFIVGIILLALVTIGATVVVMKIRSNSVTHTQVSRQLSYPGARTVVDIGSNDGSGVLQMETTDSFEKVAAWYESNLKPTKTVRVTSTTVIMKNDNITATIVGTAEGANIVIKQSKP